jgi:UDP-3-O-acyl-N-acetylglucosamine deacetylase
MAEHIIAMKLGLNIDNLIVRVDSGDPPLFDRGSFDLVEKIKSVGLRETEKQAVYYTVTEPVTVASPSGSFLTLTPCDGPEPVLNFDCAIDFSTAIGRQRIRFPVHPGRFEYAAWARTNTSFAKMFYCYTVGKLFADIRNLGYTSRNILIASRFGYFNKPRLEHENKSLEAVWHRACLDLLAAFALLEGGRFAGNVISYKAGHGLDVETIRLLYRHGLLRVWNGAA